MNMDRFYKKISVQIWIFLLGFLIFAFGVWMLVDLRYFHLTVGPTEGRRIVCRDEWGREYEHVDFEFGIGLIYVPKVRGLSNSNVSHLCKYSYDEIYVDVYATIDKKLVWIETVPLNESRTYSENFYDCRGIEVFAHLENAKISFPPWRYIVPIVLFVLSVPVMALTVCAVVVLCKTDKEAEVPIETSNTFDL